MHLLEPQALRPYVSHFPDPSALHDAKRRAGVSVDRPDELETHVDRVRQDAGAARKHAVHLGLGARQSEHFVLSAVTLTRVLPVVMTAPEVDLRDLVYPSQSLSD